MIVKPIKSILLTVFLLLIKAGIAQYLANPSFEGTPQPHVPPPGWEICDFSWSTPDTQPGQFGVYLPPSHGYTYLGMTARDDFTWEDVHSTLITPLSQDSCYVFRIDLAYQPVVNGISMSPIVLKIYGHNTVCNKSNLLWQSPATDNEDWITHEFPIIPDQYDINDIVLEAYYTGTNPYWGYILMDNIKIEQQPEVDLGNDTTLTLCENDSLVLNAGGGYAGYFWSTGASDSTIIVDTTGTYWVQVMNQYGCVAYDTIDVTIEEYIEMETFLIDSTMACVGQVVTFVVGVNYGAPPYTFFWPDLNSEDSIVTVAVDSTAYYVVEITDNCGNIVADSVKLIVTDGPEVFIGNDTIICFGDELEITTGGGYSAYLWQDGSQDSVYTATNEGWYWVLVMDNMGCTNIDSLLIEYYPEVNPQLGNDTVLCLSDDIVLDVGSGWVGILWFDGTVEQTITVSEPGNYWVTVLDENGCTGSDTISVELSPAVVVSLGGDTTLCIGDDYILNPGENFTSYLWQDGSTGAYYTIVNSGVYWVEVTDIYGCNGADTVSIDFVPSPEVNLGNDTTICSGTTLTLNPGTQYSSYLWQDNSTLPQYTVNTTGFYSVTVTNVYNCPASDEIFIEITSPDIDLGPDTLLCIGDTLLLDPGQGYVSYLWQDNTTQSQYTVLNGGVYNVTVTDTYNCTTIDTVSIEGHSKPEADLGEDQPLCEGESILLETIQGPYEYSWNGIPGDHTLEVSTGGTYTVEVSNQCGMITDQIDVTEFPVPSVNLGQDQVIFEGDVLELDAGEGFDNYVWQDGSGEQYFIITESNYNTDDPYYYVEVTDGPCKSSDTTRIILFRVKIPNVFTPNGDNKNDKFVPMEDGWNGVNSHHIEIFNRWGEKVWESDDFESGWDGKRNGNYVSDGTYFWVLDVYYGETSITQRLKGTVSIVNGKQ